MISKYLFTCTFLIVEYYQTIYPATTRLPKICQKSACIQSFPFDPNKIILEQNHHILTKIHN